VVAEHLNRRRKAVNGTSILLVGLAYKANSGDARQSPALDVARRLADRGAWLTAVDPLINPEHVPSFVRIVPLTTEHVERVDLVLVLTDHDALDWSLLERWPARILDIRNQVKAPEAERLCPRGIAHPSLDLCRPREWSPLTDSRGPRANRGSCAACDATKGDNAKKSIRRATHLIEGWPKPPAIGKNRFAGTAF
jgi:hypothetical protein